jgi:hypothetical protein
MQIRAEKIQELERLKIYLKSLDVGYENSTLSFIDKICEYSNQFASVDPNSERLSWGGRLSELSAVFPTRGRAYAD